MGKMEKNNDGLMSRWKGGGGELLDHETYRYTGSEPTKTKTHMRAFFYLPTGSSLCTCYLSMTKHILQQALPSPPAVPRKKPEQVQKKTGGICTSRHSKKKKKDSIQAKNLYYKGWLY